MEKEKWREETKRERRGGRREVEERWKGEGRGKARNREWVEGGGRKEKEEREEEREMEEEQKDHHLESSPIWHRTTVAECSIH